MHLLLLLLSLLHSGPACEDVDTNRDGEEHPAEAVAPQAEQPAVEHGVEIIPVNDFA